MRKPWSRLLALKPRHPPEANSQPSTPLSHQQLNNGALQEQSIAAPLVPSKEAAVHLQLLHSQINRRRGTQANSTSALLQSYTKRAFIRGIR